MGYPLSKAVMELTNIQAASDPLPREGVSLLELAEYGRTQVLLQDNIRLLTLKEQAVQRRLDKIMAETDQCSATWSRRYRRASRTKRNVESQLFTANTLLEQLNAKYAPFYE